MTRLIRESSGASSWFDCCVFSSQAEQWFWFWVLGLALRRRCSAFCIDLMWRRGGKVYTARFVGDEVKEKQFLGFPFRAQCSEPFKFKVHHITWYTYPSHTASPRCPSSLHLPPFIHVCGASAFRSSGFLPPLFLSIHLIYCGAHTQWAMCLLVHVSSIQVSSALSFLGLAKPGQLAFWSWNLSSIIAVKRQFISG